jgi:RNA polymerase sigma-70 factor (ECF subfamily)
MDSKRDTYLSDLMVSAQNGNNKDYALFLNEVSKMLRPYLGKRMASDKAEDVLQETLLTIHQARHTYLPSRKIEPWIYAICSHRLIDYFRKYRRIEKNEVIDFELIETAASPQAAATNEKADRVFGLLDKLPIQQKTSIELLKLEELSVKDVSQRMGMSESAVKVTAFRGYETIRRWLRIDSNEN